MSKIIIKFKELDPETSQIVEYQDNFMCEIENKVISYFDNNNTKHQIFLDPIDLKIVSKGTYGVQNHYNLDKITELVLNMIENEQNQEYKINIQTSVLNILETVENIKIELKYDLIENNEIISNHDILMEVFK